MPDRPHLLFRAIFERSSDAMLLADDDARLLEANPAACHMLALEHEELIGKRIGDILVEFEPDQTQALWKDFLDSESQRGQVTLRRGDGTLTQADYVATANIVPGWHLSVLRRDEARNRAFEELKRTRAEAEEASRLKDEFLSALSHELRTPLNAISGWAQLLQMREKELPDDLRRGVTVIERAARAQTQLISDLLDISRIVSGKLKIDMQPSSLVRIMDLAIDAVRPAAHAKRIQIECEGDRDVELRCDASRLQQVFWNLLSNALKFTRDGGSVRVGLRTEATHVHVQVQDTGEGIDATVLPHIFDRFRQADASTSRRHGGMGLGLAIVREIVHAHGGDVWAESAGTGHGATFHLRLPVQDAVSVTPSIPVPAQPLTRRTRKRTGGSDYLKGLRILVVEDDADSRSLMGKLLEDCGADVTAVDSSQSALQHVVAQPPDIIVSDLGMSGMDGYAFIRQVRALTLPVQPAAMAVTAYARPEDQTRALAAGYQQYLSKPIEIRALLQAVAKLGRPAR